MEQDVDHGPGEDPLAQVLATAAGVAEAAGVAHREGPGVTVTLSEALHTTTTLWHRYKIEVWNRF